MNPENRRNTVPPPPNAEREGQEVEQDEMESQAPAGVSEVFGDPSKFIQPTQTPDGYLWVPDFMPKERFGARAIKKEIQERGLTQEELQTPENKAAFESALVFLLGRGIYYAELKEFVDIGVLSEEEIKESEAIQTAAQERFLRFGNSEDMDSFLKYSGVIDRDKLRTIPAVQEKLQDMLSAWLHPGKLGSRIKGREYLATRIIDWGILDIENINHVAVAEIDKDDGDITFIQYFKDCGYISEADFSPEAKERLSRKVGEAIRKGDMALAYGIKRLGIFEDDIFQNEDTKFFLQDTLETELKSSEYERIDDKELAAMLGLGILTNEEVLTSFKNALIRNIRRQYPIKRIMETLLNLPYAEQQKFPPAKTDLKPLCEDIIKSLREESQIFEAMEREKKSWRGWIVRGEEIEDEEY